MALGVAPTLDVRLFLLKLPVAGNSVLAKASEQQFHAGLAAFSERKITSSAGISIACSRNFIFAFYFCPCGQPLGIASGIGPAQASISSRGCGTRTSGALASSCTGAGGTGRTIELVVSADGCGWSMMLSMPELDVQPVKAAARAMAVTSEKRMGTVTQNKGLQCSA
nr:hypothetical protein [Brucella melitensis]